VCGLVLFEAVAGFGLFSPLWDVPEAGPATLATIAPVLLVSVVGSALAAGFVYVTRVVRLTARYAPVWVRPALGGLVIGVLALWSPYALTFGEDQLPSLVSLEMTVGALAVAAVAKLVAAAVCAGTEWKGGFIIPLFFVGAAVGQALHVLLPGTDAALMVTCGMVATCVGVTKTPLGSTLVVAGTTGFALTPMLLIAAIVAFVLTRRLSHFDSQRSRDRTPTADDQVSDP
jgi:H+/Cl- antiporter ClcA